MGSSPARGPADDFSPGDWNIICSICGTKLKFRQAVQNWQGTWRHPKCNEPRHPQDFVHARNVQEMTIPYAQNMAEAFIGVCSLNGQSAIPGYALPGCKIPGNPFFDVTGPVGN